MIYRRYRIEQEGDEWIVMNLRKVELARCKSLEDAYKLVNLMYIEEPDGKK